MLRKRDFLFSAYAKCYPSVAVAIITGKIKEPIRPIPTANLWKSR
jgi:hypothetical protein